MKLLAVEPETDALREYLRSHQELRRVSSALVRVELPRAARRGGPGSAAQVPSLLAALALVRVDDALLDAAGALSPTSLRSLDALHLASALRVAPVTAVVTYDIRMQEAAGLLGLPVAAPSG